MDAEFLKQIIGVIAQHGPWALFATWVTWVMMKRAEAQTQALVQTAEALTALKTHLEMISAHILKGEKP